MHSLFPSAQHLLRLRVLFLGGQPTGRRHPGDLGAAPVCGRAQRAWLRAEAPGCGAAARDGGGVDALCQFQQKSWVLFEGQVIFPRVLSPGPRGTRRWACNQGSKGNEAVLGRECTLIHLGLFTGASVSSCQVVPISIRPRLENPVFVL